MTGRTTFALIQAPVPVEFGPYIETQLDPALDKAAAAEGFDAGMTSYALLAAGGDQESSSVLVETLLGAAGALVVLLFVFASFLALLPLLIAGVSILTTFMLVLGLTTFSDVSIIVQFLIALIGLGVAIDYSLILVSRWREERAHGRSNEQAVVVAMKRPVTPSWPQASPWRSAFSRWSSSRACPSQHGNRWHADPAGQRRGGPHAVASSVVQHRAAHRLSPHPQGKHSVARLVGMGPDHRPTPVRRHSDGRRDAHTSHHPVLQHPDRTGFER
jgi:hypothetical protein